jgi:alpha/beta hydrolase family protein
MRSLESAIAAVAIATLTGAGLLAAGGAGAHVTEIRVDAVEPFADGHEFGDAGAYERVRGVAKGELDPLAPENAVIADLAKAPRNARGMVAYETDFFILRPAQAGKGAGVLFYEVNNRGRKLLPLYIEEALSAPLAALNDPKSADDMGFGFTLNRGYTLVWSGWDPDAPTAANGLAIRVPVALENGRPIVQRIREEILVGTRGSANVEVARLTYPAAAVDKAGARLTVRKRESDPRSEIPASGWEFADARSIRLTPPGTRFMPVKIYELWYEATGAKIVGMGFAATRDFVSFLRYERADANGTPNPALASGAEEGPRYALAFGVSQAGRYLRHHLDLGMNKDERGRRVFDGVLAHISGAGKVFANHTFAEPGRTATQHEDRFYPENWFPFSAATTTDPFSGKTAALFKGDASDPKLIETNTSTEYWQKGASLLHIDAAGASDLALPANARVYLIAGTQHGGRAGLDTSPGACANPRNPHSAGPALRALIVALEEWVTRDVAPPDSRMPAVRDESAVEAAAVRMPAVKGFAPAPAANRIRPPVDWVNPPGSSGTVQVAGAAKAYATRVSAVDADGNEIAGIRLPPIAVPVGTHTGWNAYKSAPGELCDRDGSFIAFAHTKAEREATGDPRPSLAERYGTRSAYAAKVGAAADALVAQRLLLPVDAATYVQAAEASDRF